MPTLDSLDRSQLMSVLSDLSDLESRRFGEGSRRLTAERAIQSAQAAHAQAIRKARGRRKIGIALLIGLGVFPFPGAVMIPTGLIMVFAPELFSAVDSSFQGPSVVIIGIVVALFGVACLLPGLLPIISASRRLKALDRGTAFAQLNAFVAAETEKARRCQAAAAALEGTLRSRYATYSVPEELRFNDYDCGPELVLRQLRSNSQLTLWQAIGELKQDRFRRQSLALQQRQANAALAAQMAMNDQLSSIASSARAAEQSAARLEWEARRRR